MMSIYHWKLGDIALAKLCKKVYAKVKVVKNENGIFYDDKVLAITPKSDDKVEATKELCYYVEITRSGQRLWLPYTSLHLAERSRPFYGTDRPVEKKVKPEKPVVPKKRKLKEDYIVPLDVKICKHKEPDLNTTFDARHMPLKQGRYENAYSEFIRRGKEELFDHFYYMLETDTESNYDVLDYVKNVDASTEDKFEEVVKRFVSEKEIENYLRQCWRYNFLNKQSCVSDKADLESNKENIDPNAASPPAPPVAVHIHWCLVCGGGAGGGSGGGGRLRECVACPAAFHLACRREWLITIIHRKSPPAQPPPPPAAVRKVLSRTRALALRPARPAASAPAPAPAPAAHTTELCPSCMWGPNVGYDDVVWHKLGACAWWPARVLAPGCVPPCLLARRHSKHHWPLRYYGTLNHAWGERGRMVLFLPAHAALWAGPGPAAGAGPGARDPARATGILDACDDYIALYLTFVGLLG